MLAAEILTTEAEQLTKCNTMQQKKKKKKKEKKIHSSNSCVEKLW